MAVLEKPLQQSDPFAERLGPGLAPEGTFVAVIEDIADEFQVERRKYQSEETELVDLTTFLFCYQDPQGKVHRLSSRRMKISGHEKSTLFGFLKSILGRAPKMGWDYLEMRGHQCLLTVEHLPRRDGEGVFAAVASLSPVPQSMVTGQGVRSEVGVQGMGAAGGVKPNVEHRTSNAEHRNGEAGHSPSVEGEEELPY